MKGQRQCAVLLWGLKTCNIISMVENGSNTGVIIQLSRNLSCLYLPERKSHKQEADTQSMKSGFTIHETKDNFHSKSFKEDADAIPLLPTNNHDPRTTSSSASVTWTKFSKLRSLLKKNQLNFSAVGELSGASAFCCGSFSGVGSRRGLHTHTHRHCLSLCHAGVRKHPPWRILFFGTDDLSVSSLRTLQENRESDVPYVSDLEVVTNHGQTAVRQYATEQNLRVIEWPPCISSERYDVGVLVSFGKLIPAKIINKFPYGIINIHPSLLPHWRGASPIIHTILNGETETGVSVMDIRPKHFDMGPILMQRRVSVPERMTSCQLSRYLQPVMSDMLLKSLLNLPRLEKLEHEQGSRGVTYAHKITTVNTLVDWENATADDVDRQYRAFGELLSLRTTWNGHSIRLHKMVEPEIMEDLDLNLLRPKLMNLSTLCPGTMFLHKRGNFLAIKCKEGMVGFREIVIRKKMTPQSFYNGHIHKAENRDIPCTSHRNYLNMYRDSEKIPAQLMQ